jgi:hypothetical protein
MEPVPFRARMFGLGITDPSLNRNAFALYLALSAAVSYAITAGIHGRWRKFGPYRATVSTILAPALVFLLGLWRPYFRSFMGLGTMATLISSGLLTDGILSAFVTDNYSFKEVISLCVQLLTYLLALSYA